MLLYPEVQTAAQEEIDRVIGSDRLPEYEDREALPYVTAMMKETLRYVNRSRFSYMADWELGGTL